VIWIVRSRGGARLRSVGQAPWPPFVPTLHDDEEEVKYVKLGNDMIEVVLEFCYLSDVVGSSGDVQSSVTARIRAGWRKFNELSQVLFGRVLSLELKGRLYKCCIRSVISYGSECWAMKKVGTSRTQAAEMKMIRMMRG